MAWSGTINAVLTAATVAVLYISSLVSPPMAREKGESALKLKE